MQDSRANSVRDLRLPIISSRGHELHYYSTLTAIMRRWFYFQLKSLLSCLLFDSFEKRRRTPEHRNFAESSRQKYRFENLLGALGDYSWNTSDITLFAPASYKIAHQSEFDVLSRSEAENLIFGHSAEVAKMATSVCACNARCFIPAVIDKLRVLLATKFFNVRIISGGKQYFLNSPMPTLRVVVDG